MDISGSEVPAHAVPGVGAGHTTHERGLSIKPRTAAVCSGAAGSKRLRGGGRPRAVLHVGNAERQRVGPESLDSSFSERPNLRAEATAERRPPCTSRRSQGKKKGHSLIDKVYSRKVSVHVGTVRETCSPVSMPRMIKVHDHHTPFPT